MSPSKIVCLGHNADRADTVARHLREELTGLTVRATTGGEVTRIEACDSLACLVYEAGDTEPEDVFERAREEHPAVPFVLVVSQTSDVSIGEILDADRTAVVRRTGHSEDMSVLVNRVQTLIETHRREGELSAARARFHTLFENLTQPLVEIEFRGGTPIVERVNRAFEEVFGYQKSEIQGESLDEFVVPPDRRDEATELNDRVLNGDVFTVEVTRQTADGPREFLLRNAVYPEMPGEFAMYVDITERKQRERELERQNERLDQFASMVSHDLRNPLTVAQLQTDLVVREHDSENARATMDALERMETIVDEMLRLARAGQDIESTEECPVPQVARNAWGNVQTPNSDLGVRVEDETLEADAARLSQVFENLFRNALDHNEPPLAIRVGALDAGDGFYVEDDGDGIPEDERTEVFEQGYTTDKDGNGLGLTIVDDIVDAHGWDITVTDSEAGGARFEIRTG